MVQNLGVGPGLQLICLMTKYSNPAQKFSFGTYYEGHKIWEPHGITIERTVYVGSLRKWAYTLNPTVTEDPHGTSV
jgi:hypothetical protein